MARVAQEGDTGTGKATAGPWSSLLSSPLSKVPCPAGSSSPVGSDLLAGRPGLRHLLTWASWRRHRRGRPLQPPPHGSLSSGAWMLGTGAGGTLLAAGSLSSYAQRKGVGGTPPLLGREVRQ